jgi:NTP pyrophosphatase (non-canonical NTP hydrolase)
VSKLTSEQEEILTIAQEECAEVIQVVSKGNRFGFDVEYNSKTNRQKLTQEVGDVLCMIDLMVEKDILTAEGLEQAKKAKREKLKQWSRIGV